MKTDRIFVLLFVVLLPMPGCLDLDDLAEIDTGPGLVAYIFTVEDSSDTVTTSANDSLVDITLSAGAELNWSAVKISILVDDNAPINCDYGSDVGECYWEIDEDDFWSLEEEITIIEGSVSLCDDTCEIDLTITKRGENGDSDKALASLTAMVD